MRRSGPKNRRRLKPTSPLAAGAGRRVPFMAIVGRPNVGKSTLFNRLMGKRISIVEKTAGTTRDRVSAVLELPSRRRVELCDMGGLGGTEDPLDRDVDRQIRSAMDLADIVLFVVDSRDGATPLDKQIAQRVLKLGKPVVLVANKAETHALESLAGELYVLGCGDPVAISAREGTGKTDLVARLEASITAHEKGLAGAVELPPEPSAVVRGQGVGPDQGDADEDDDDAGAADDDAADPDDGADPDADDADPDADDAGDDDDASDEGDEAEPGDRSDAAEPAAVEDRSGPHGRPATKIDTTRPIGAADAREFGKGDLVDPAAGEQLELRIAVVGRRNAGKSSFVNALFGSERVIVSDRPGTTRDAVDVRCIVDDFPIVLIDTAGLRKRGKADDAIELISHGRAVEAVRRADVAFVVIDALRDISEVDKKILELCLGENKAVVLVANKWDLVEEGMTLDAYAEYVRKKVPSIVFVPVVGISCKTGMNVKIPIRVARELHRQATTRVGTGALNRVVHEAYTRRRPRKKRHLQARLYFATQIRVNPVTLVVFVNKPTLFDDDYQRYLCSELRARLPWSEVPIKLVIRERHGLLEKGLTRAARQQRALARTRALVEDDVIPDEATLAELDHEEIREALSEELFAEEAETTANSVFARPDDIVRIEDAAAVEDEDEDAGDREPEHRPRGQKPITDTLYGEDADVVRRQLARKNRRRGRGGGKKDEKEAPDA